jgi:glycosyltransferase involved in cell wall biosynthesis
VLEILSFLNILSLMESRVKIHRDDRPFNYSQLNNTAVDISKGDIVALVNNDIEVISPEWLSEMVS